MKIARRPKALPEIKKALLHDNGRNNSPGIWPHNKQYCLITYTEKNDRIKRLNRPNHNLWDFYEIKTSQTRQNNDMNNSVITKI